MNDSTPPTHPAARGSGRRSLYRTVLSLAVAAVIAASIPFAAIYVAAVHQGSSLIAQAPTSLTAGKHPVTLITTASGRQVPVSGSAGSAHNVPAVLTTHASPAGGSDN